MKTKNGIRIALIGLCLAPVWSKTLEPSNLEDAFTDERDKLSYALGVIFGLGLRGDGYDVEMVQLSRGLTDAYEATNRLRLSGPLAREVLDRQESVLQEKMKVAKQQLADRNRRLGEEFLAENAKKPGIRVMPSGIQFRELLRGTGSNPGTNDTVRISYRGRVLNGTEFETSKDRGAPGEITLSDAAVIPGLREALCLMPVGSKWEVYIPSSVGYSNGLPNRVEAGSTVIYELELLDARPTSLALAEAKKNAEEANRKAAEEFLAKNGANREVIVLPSGLQYQVLASGSGEVIGKGDTVEVKWRGTLVNGIEIANTLVYEDPVVIDLTKSRYWPSGVTEAISRMRVGDRWRVFIPPHLGYGKEGRKPSIPSWAVLVYEIAVVSTDHPNVIEATPGTSPFGK